MKVNLKKIVAALFFAALFGVTLSLLLPMTITNGVGAKNEDTLLHPHSFTFEVAENGTRFSPDEGPVFDEDGFPAYGAAFITQGYLYPDGTLTCDTDGNCDGVLPDGSAEFPDAVIGEWTCWGYHVSDGAHTETGPIVATTQMFSFGDEPGAEMLTSTGYEYVDINTPFKRAVTGGTGVYRDAGGEQNQELLGLNNGDKETFGVSLRVTFDLEGVSVETE